MSAGKYSHTTRATGTIVTATIYNGDHENHIQNANPNAHGALADTLTEYRSTEDPGMTGAESYPDTLAGELKRIRYTIQRLSGGTNWYDPPVGTPGLKGTVISPAGGDSDLPTYAVSGGQFMNFDWLDDLTGQSALMYIGRNTKAQFVKERFYVPGTTTIAAEISTENGGQIAGGWIAGDADLDVLTEENGKIATPLSITKYIGNRLATQAEAQAGTNQVKIMTPLRTAQAVSQLANNVLHVRDEKATGTQGGTFTAGGWQTRALNIVKTNTITGASLNTSLGRISLPAGTYDVEARAPAFLTANHQTRLQNITDAATSLIGASSRTSDNQTDSLLRGRVVLTKTTVFELQHMCSSSQATNGLGNACNFGVVEVYAEVKISRIA
jgi:hypothetical protein